MVEVAHQNRLINKINQGCVYSAPKDNLGDGHVDRRSVLLALSNDHDAPRTCRIAAVFPFTFHDRSIWTGKRFGGAWLFNNLWTNCKITIRPGR